MLTKICLLLLLQVGLWIGCVNGQAITVAIAPEAKVEGAFITLGQLAEISGDDRTRVESLQQLKLGSAASPGSRVVLTKDLLGMRLAAAGSDFRGITWNIPDTVTVTTSSQSVGRQTLIDKAIEAIERQAGVSISQDFSVVSDGSVQDVIIPMGTVVITSELPYGIRYNAPTTVSIAVNVNGQLFTKVGLKFAVKSYGQVAVANDHIGSGQILKKEHFRYERMDIGRLAPGYYTDINKVLGLKAKRVVTPGMVVTNFMVNKPLLIKRGTQVNIVARMGSMEVRTAGQAMQDGTEGQMIRVKNISSNKSISGKVLDEGTVQVVIN